MNREFTASGLLSPPSKYTQPIGPCITIDTWLIKFKVCVCVMWLFCRLLINSLASRDSSDGEGSESEDSSGAEPSVETEEASEITMSCGSTVIGKDERAIFLKKQSK